MNRRATREQNDISIIIGNLPKRLQKKIADEVNGDNVATGGHRSASEKVAEKHDDQTKKATTTKTVTDATVVADYDKDVPRIDYFLRMSGKTNMSHERASSSSAPDLEASGEAATNSNHRLLVKTAEGRTDASAIPGILRVNTADTLRPSSKTAGGGGSSNTAANVAARENGRRPVAPRNDIASREELPKSPARQLLKSTNVPPWFEALDAAYVRPLRQLYDALQTMCERNVVLENWPEYCETRAQLQQIFMQLLLHQLKFCCEQKVDTFFWKLLYYNAREYLKQQQSTQANTCTLALIEDGLKFYTELYAQLSAKYIDDAHVLPAADAERSRNAHKFEFIAKVAAQKLLICLGDLSRYKAKQLQASDYGEATNYYQQAQRLIPTNGIPYNQLAIVAIHSRKKFDAIYFHMRSLMSSNAIYSARESLLVLFDEIRKKYEETELKSSPMHQSPINRAKSTKSLRKEVWIYPDGVRRMHRTNNTPVVNKSVISEENRLSEMTNDDLLRRFTSLYLYVIGKLYMGIGLESIHEQQKKLLVQWSALLKRDTLPIKRSRMLKTIALNIFVLEHNMHKDSRRETRYYTFNFCCQMFSIVLRKCNQLLTSYVNAAESMPAESFADLNTLLQFIKIFADWLQLNVTIWEPSRNEEHIVVDTWTELEQLFQLLKRTQATSFIAEVSDASVIELDEDQFLAGFTPLASNNASPAKRALIAPSEAAQFHARIAQICSFETCFVDNRQRLVLPEETHFILEELNTAIKSVFNNLQSDEDDNSENIVVNGLKRSKSAVELKLEKCGSVVDAQVSQLSKLKKELEAKTNVKKMYNEKLEEILKFVDTKLYIEVRPKYLLPDTNCFIDCLEDFERLVQQFKRFTLVIPLTVVKELDGLSKGMKLDLYEKSQQKHRIHHFDDVTTRAKKSLHFINTVKNNVKCATTKGSIINASLFALVEEENVSNDDKILATALALSKTMSSETSKDGKCLIQTELVLITTDRNLRVKALSRNLAVSELSEFLQWAEDCNTT